MKRHRIGTREDWEKTARQSGFNFSTVDGQQYWDESACYQFTMEQIERDIEAVSVELHQMCLEVVDKVFEEPRWLESLCVPESHWDWIYSSWKNDESSLYGRFDLRYDGASPAKLYEYNADTPTSLFESAYFQWIWLEEAAERKLIPQGADQFNCIQEKLIAHLEAIASKETFYVSSVKSSLEDKGTVDYFQDCARQAGLRSEFIYIDDIGIDTRGQFCDLQNRPIRHLFKLYPWEWMLSEEFSVNLQACDTHFYEPPWKTILSNKGLLALLWHFFEGHPNLLPSYFQNDPRITLLDGSYAIKPLFSREGANIQLLNRGILLDTAPGPYGSEGAIIQALNQPPVFEGNHTVIGSWIVGNEACGIGIREDAGRITRDSSRFVPHYIGD